MEVQRAMGKKASGSESKSSNSRIVVKYTILVGWKIHTSGYIHQIRYCTYLFLHAEVVSRETQQSCHTSLENSMTN